MVNLDSVDGIVRSSFMGFNYSYGHSLVITGG